MRAVPRRWDSAFGLLTFLGATALATSEDGVRKLTQARIGAHLAGKEVTDGVDWAEQYMRDETCKAFHMSKATPGRLVDRNGELASRRDNRTGMQEVHCRHKVEFRCPAQACRLSRAS